MNTAQLKVISWSAALVFGAGLALYVGNYLMHKPQLEQRVAPATITGALSKVPNVEKKAEDIVAYDRVNEALYKYNWTAKPPPKPAPIIAPVPEGPKGPIPVAQLLKVLLYKTDSVDDSGTTADARAVIKYLAPAQVKLKEPTVVKHVGDSLDDPWQGITVAAITKEGVRFKFADANRPEELLVPGEFERRLDMEWLAKNPGSGGMLRPKEIAIGRGPNYNTAPERTVELRPGEFTIGTEDIDDWAENYDVYLNQIEAGKHRDPTTGKYDGIALTSVPANSVAAAHGVQEGDVIKSINGQLVNTKQEAIAYIKQNKDKFDVWEVVIESKGKEKTIVYKVPKKH
ncbi:MAG TPA: PDZ domain-containing protein [Planctomycetota bacterium]|nr:PDZ domain-containing protein [Planctomycetota bacterium]